MIHLSSFWSNYDSRIWSEVGVAVVDSENDDTRRCNDDRRVRGVYRKGSNQGGILDRVVKSSKN